MVPSRGVTDAVIPLSLPLSPALPLSLSRALLLSNLSPQSEEKPPGSDVFILQRQ